MPQSLTTQQWRRPAWRWLPIALAGALGALNTLSFAPTPHGGWFEIALFAAFFALLARRHSLRAALWVGGAFGVGNFVTGVWWLYVSMHFYGGMPAPMAAAAVVLFALYLGVYPALAAGLWHLCTPPAARRGWLSALLFGSAWALGEWLRGTVFTGFPWLASGYPQVDGPLAGIGAIAGVYGVGWVLAVLGALLAHALAPCSDTDSRDSDSGNAGADGAGADGTDDNVDDNQGHNPDDNRGHNRGDDRGDDRGENRATCRAARAQRKRRRGAAGAAAVLIVAAALGAGQIRWTQPSAQPPLSVRLLQGNVPQDMKFSEAGQTQAIALYQRLITEAPADLVVTPETAIAVLMQDIPAGFASAVRSFSDTTGSAVLFGTVGATLTAQGPTNFTNTTLGISPSSRTLFRYDKHHLVPFGEFVPWGFRWFVDLMRIPLGDFARGPAVQAAFEVHGERLAVDICYEDIFGEEIARSLRQQAEPASILVNSTNLAWFGNTIALDQHLQIARMRALETGRPILRATNTGATAIIGADGRVLARLPAFTVGALSGRVQGTTGFTPYVRYGNTPILLLALALLAYALLARWRSR